MAKKSKRIGKDGERAAKRFLESAGYYVASTEIQGLAGDDIFCRDGNGEWWSVEVKSTATFISDYLKQARDQCQSRYYAIQQVLKDKDKKIEHEVFHALGLDKFKITNYFLMWRPRMMNFAWSQWIVFKKDGNTFKATVFNLDEEGYLEPESNERPDDSD